MKGVFETTNKMPPTVRLKHLDKQRPVEARKVIELAYGKFNVPFTRIFTTNEGFKVICRNENDADKILGMEARNELEKLGLQIVMPPEMKARRSLILKQLDTIIGSNSAEDIKEEIERENPWMKIEEVIKIKNYTHILKLRTEETSMVEKASKQGILAYNMAISPSQIEQETYIHIITCFNCYQMEDHLTKDCPYSNLKICSECSELGHTYRECKNTAKGCINCKNYGQQYNHRTLAMSCPLRKKIIKEKTDEQKTTVANQEQSTYAAIAKRAVAEVKNTGKLTQINLSETKHTKILISIMHAHVMNMCNPGTYQTELNRMLQKNELPMMWFPDNPDSGNLLGATYTTQENNTEETAEDQNETDTESTITDNTPTTEKSNRDPRLESRKIHQETGTIPKARGRNQSRSRATNEQTSEQFHTPKEAEYPVSASEIGLKIHLTGKNIVPTMDPHVEYVVDQIHQGSYKWTYTDTRHDEESIKRLLTLKEIRITKQDFKRVDEGSFRKIRNGLNVRSPVQEYRKTKKHT